MRVVSQRLRDSARGEDCTLRLPGVCNFQPETTVLAHVPCGQRGIGMKGPDQISAYTCSACHDALDGRSRGVEVDGWDVIRAVAETQQRMIEKGLLSVAGNKRG